MQRKIRRVIMFMLLITITLANVAYAQPTTRQYSPYGPKIEDLKGKENIIQNLEQMKRIRANLTVVEIAESSTGEQLKNTYKDLENYIQQLNIIRTNLENHKNTYKNSFPDIYFSEEISFVVESYIISLRNQQSLITALETSKTESKKLFYSNYLIPVYYYLTLGDQMVSYVDTYFVVS